MKIHKKTITSLFVWFSTGTFCLQGQALEYAPFSRIPDHQEYAPFSRISDRQEYIPFSRSPDHQKYAPFEDYQLFLPSEEFLMNSEDLLFGFGGGDQDPIDTGGTADDNPNAYNDPSLPINDAWIVLSLLGIGYACLTRRKIEKEKEKEI